MDMPILPEWVVQYIAILSNISVITTAIFGIVSLRQWRVQLRYGDKYKTARQIIGLALRFKKEFLYTREYVPSCLSTARGKSVEEIRRDMPQLKSELAERRRRLKILYETVDKLYEENMFVEGLLKKGYSELIEPLTIAYEELNRTFLEYDQTVQSIETCKFNQETLDKFNTSCKFIFSGDDDELSKKVDLAVANIQKKLKRYIA